MISCEINGRAVTAADLSSEAERAKVAAIIGDTAQRIRSLFDDDEWSQIHVKLTGSSTDDLTMNVSGPDYLVERVYEGLGESA